MNKVSQHCSWDEAIRSDVAIRAGINNYFTPGQLKRMVDLAEKVYEPLVSYFGKPIYIASFFRNKKVNELVGGSLNSQHLANSGAAMDLDGDMTEGVDNKSIFSYIQHNLEFDQLILENVKEDGSVGWVHVSYKEGANRKEMLRMVIKDGYSTYEVFEGFEKDEELSSVDVINVPISSTDSDPQNIMLNIILIILLAIVTSIPIILFILYKKFIKLFKQLFNKEDVQKGITIPTGLQFKINFVMLYKFIKKILKKTRYVFKKNTRVV